MGSAGTAAPALARGAESREALHVLLKVLNELPPA